MLESERSEMEHAMQVIAESGAQPMVKQEGFMTGKTVLWASSIVEQFVTSDKGTSKVQLLRDMAEELTVKEFTEHVKKAQDLSSGIDTENGFIAQSGKGTPSSKRYGPMRNTMNTQVSVMRQIYGAMRIALDEFEEITAIQSALHLARAVLEDNGMKWDGTKIPDAEQKKAIKATRAYKDARDKVETDNPQKAGESIADWQARTGELIEGQVIVDKYNQAREFLLTLFGNDQNLLYGFHADEEARLNASMGGD